MQCLFEWRRLIDHLHDQVHEQNRYNILHVKLILSANLISEYHNIIYLPCLSSQLTAHPNTSCNSLASSDIFRFSTTNKENINPLNPKIKI